MSEIARLLARFLADRDAALTSLDEGRIRAFYRKWYDSELPSDPLIFWGSIHKAITGCTSLPIEFRRTSKRWLEDHGLHPHDDGDA